MDVRNIKGIGEKRAELLGKLGLHTVADVLYDFPRGYRDRTKVMALFFELPEGEVLFRGRILRKYFSKSSLFLEVSSELARLKIIFFNARFLNQKFVVGEEYYFFGNISDGMIANPEFSHTDSEEFLRIVPIYGLTEGLSQNIAEQIHQGALSISKKNALPENLPFFVRRELMGRMEAIAALHSPKSFEEIEAARRRIIIEELFWIFLGILLRKNTDSVVPMRLRDVSDFRLPVSLTKAQHRAVCDIKSDLESGRVMNRLINGDVGCGKSVVAFLTAKMVSESGFQVLIMAPTTVLAEQLYSGYVSIFGGGGPGAGTAILTSRTNQSEKQSIYNGCRSGDIGVLFGTHAVLSDNLEFANLSLVITDEQQRFGIFQRQRALEKAKIPHNLYLTATPIPQTLALTFFADMDVSRIDEMPKGRKPVITRYIGDAELTKMLAFIQSRIDKGEQVYFVAPSIEESLKNVEKKLKKWLKARIVTAHGNMNSEDVQRSFESFRSGNADVLLATTMIEVGIDNPNATIIVIIDAERFGLSQLHQLRGRVGRGSSVSHCFLLSRRRINDRLQVLLDFSSGFEIAEKDLEMRGPGVFFGGKQSGRLKISFDFTSDDVGFAYSAAQRAIELYSSGDEEMVKLVQSSAKNN